MTVKEIVKLYLEANGYDGLCCDDEEDGCGCFLGDLFPCDGGAPCNLLDCIPGYRALDSTGHRIIQEDKP